MSRAPILLFLVIGLNCFSQVQTDLSVRDITKTYGDTKVIQLINENLERAIRNGDSEERISFTVLDEKDFSGSEDNILDEYYGKWYFFNAGVAKLLVQFKATKDHPEKTDTLAVTINRRKITARVDGFKVYGDLQIAYDFEVLSGSFAYAEDHHDLKPSPVYSGFGERVDANASNPQAYPITFTNNPAWNYDFTVETGFLTVEKADLYVDHVYPVGKSYYEKTYRGANPVFGTGWEPKSGLMSWDDKSAVTGTLFINPDQIDDTWECEDSNGEAKTHRLDFDVSGLSSPNYYIQTNDSATLIIRKADIALIAENKTIEYGEIRSSESTLKYYATGWLAPGDASHFRKEPKLFIDLDDNTGVGTYTRAIKFSNPGEHPNYRVVSTEPGNLQIEEVSLTIEPVYHKIRYKNELKLDQGIRISEIKNNDAETILRNQYSLEYVGNNIYQPVKNEPIKVRILPMEPVSGSSPVGKYDIEVEHFFSNPNYKVTYNTGVLEIIKSRLKIDILDIHVFVGDSAPPLQHTFECIDHDPARFDSTEVFDLDSYTCNYDKYKPAGKYSIQYNITSPEDTITDNYYVYIDPGTLTAYAHAAFSSQPEKTWICRDTYGYISVATESPNPTFQWYVKFPATQPGLDSTLRDTFLAITDVIADSAKFSGFTSDFLRIDSAQYWQEEYAFRCLLKSTIKTYPGLPEDPDVPDEKEFQWTERASELATYSVKSTPPFADISLKGESILICGDPYADTYTWKKTGDTTVYGNSTFLDIYGDEDDAALYYVITGNAATNCFTKSSLSTGNGIRAVEQFDPEMLELTVSPQPVVKGKTITVTSHLLVNDETYSLYLFDLFGEKKKSIVDRTLVNGRIPGFEIPGEIEDGFYILEFHHNKQRNAIILIVTSE